MNKPTVIAVGLFVPGSGFTRVFESLFAKLSDNYTIHWLGIGYKGELQQRKDCTLHPCNVKGGDIYGAYGAAELAKEFKARAILLLNDFYLLKNYGYAWSPLKQEGIRLVAYVPLDGDIIDASLMKDCFFLDDLVLYNQWAVNEVKAAMQKFRENNPDEKFTIPQLHYRYHGVDTKTFYPATDELKRKSLKEELFKLPDAAESIFVLNANRYNERKDIEATITAFAKALPHFNKPAYLCLHTPNLLPQGKELLPVFIKGSGCAERILLNPLGEGYVDDDTMRKLYQACAIGVNTSFGEGWGMISFEHAACGAAQIVPGHTAPAEVWSGGTSSEKDAAVIIPKDKPVKLNTNPFQMYSSDVDELTQQLVKLVNDEIYLSDVSAKCTTHAFDKRFNWDYIAGQWKELL